MKWIFFSLFWIPAMCMPPDEISKIENLYASNFWSLLAYYHEMEAGSNPCRQSKQTMEVIGVEYNDVVSEIITIEKLKLIFTLDGSTFFMGPGVIKCTLRKDEQNLPYSYYLIVQGAKGYKVDLMRVVEIENHNGKSTFTVPEVADIKILQETYENNYEKMENWYAENKENVEESDNICKKSKSQVNLPLNYDILRGIIYVGNFSLLLDERKSINLPGVLACEYKTDCDFRYFFFLVKEHSRNAWKLIHDAYTVIEGKPTFAFQEHLSFRQLRIEENMNLAEIFQQEVCASN